MYARSTVLYVLLTLVLLCAISACRYNAKMAEARAAATLLTVQPPRRPQTAASTTAIKRPHRALVTLSAPPLRSSDAPIVPPELDIVDRQLHTTSSSNGVAEAQEWAARPASSPCKSTVSCGSELEVALSLVSTFAQHNGEGTPLRSRRRHRSPAAAKRQRQRARSAAPVVTKRSNTATAAPATTATAVAVAGAKTVVRLHDVFLAYSSGQGTPPRSRRWHRKAASASNNSSSGTAAATAAAAAVPAAIAAAPAASRSSGAVVKPHRPVTAPAGTRGAPRPGRAHVAPKA
jgi:hypothetical protein